MFLGHPIYKARCCGIHLAIYIYCNVFLCVLDEPRVDYTLVWGETGSIDNPAYMYQKLDIVTMLNFIESFKK